MKFTLGPKLGRLAADGAIRTRAILAAEAAIRSHFRAKPSRSGFFAAQVAGGKVQVTELTDQRATITVDSRELSHYIGGSTLPGPGQGRCCRKPCNPSP